MAICTYSICKYGYGLNIQYFQCRFKGFLLGDHKKKGLFWHMFRYSARTQKRQSAENLVKHSDVTCGETLPYLKKFLQARLDKTHMLIICPHVDRQVAH